MDDRQRESDLERELRSHLEAEMEEQIEDGLSQSEAHYAARRAMGNLTLVQEDVRRMWGGNWFDSLGQDARYALRILRRNPGFAAAAALALALGIGANTAVFSVTNAVLLRPLPYPEAHQLLRIWETYGSPGNQGPESYPNFEDWRAWNRSFSGMAAYTGSSMILTGTGEPLHLKGLIASASLCEVLQVQPPVGRRFREEEDRPHANSGSDSVMISANLWRERFGGREDAMGRGILLDGKPFTIVGVIPAAIDARSGVGDLDFLTTIAPMGEAAPGSAHPASEIRSMSFFNIIGRLKSGVSIAQAQADLDGIGKQLARMYPKDNPQAGAAIKGLQETMTGYLRPVLLLLLGSAGLVLLIACADVAGLVVARATRRQREMTVRAAIGAGRWRMLRQLLVESMVLSLLGCGAGLWIAMALSQLLARVLRLDPVAGPTLDGRVLLFALLLAVLAAGIFSLAPAIHFSQSDLMSRLRQDSLATSGGRHQRRTHGVLVVVQVGLATVLLSAAGLLTASLIKLRHVNLGFQPDHALTFPVSLATARYKPEQRAAFFDQLTSRIEALPGVEAAGAGKQLPLEGSMSRTVISRVSGAPVQPMGIAFSSVTPKYFRALGIRIVRGREFTAADSAGAAPVVILNEAAVRRYFPNREAVGQQVVPLMWEGSGSETQPRTVVGIANDIKLQGLSNAAVPAIYWPAAQIPSDPGMFVCVRTSGDPLQLTGAVREQLRAMDPDLPLYNAFELNHYMEQQLVQPRSTAMLTGMLTALALILTAVGLYGVVAYSVARRTREIGIRMALGASRRGILLEFLRSGLWMSLAGVAAGVPAAVVTSSLLKSLLFGVSGQKPLIFAGGAVFLIAVSVLASYLPAWRATRIDPTTALRYE